MSYSSRAERALLIEEVCSMNDGYVPIYNLITQSTTVYHNVSNIFTGLIGNYISYP